MGLLFRHNQVKVGQGTLCRGPDSERFLFGAAHPPVGDPGRTDDRKIADLAQDEEWSAARALGLHVVELRPVDIVEDDGRPRGGPWIGRPGRCAAAPGVRYATSSTTRRR